MGKDLVQYDSRMGYWKGKGESRRFVPLTNFAMKFTKFVRSPEQLPDYAGFIVKVTQPSGKRITEGSVSIHCLYNCSILALLSMVIWYSDRVSCRGTTSAIATNCAQHWELQCPTAYWAVSCHPLRSRKCWCRNGRNCCKFWSFMPSCIARSVYSAKHMHELFLRRMIAVLTMHGYYG